MGCRCFSSGPGGHGGGYCGDCNLDAFERHAYANGYDVIMAVSATVPTGGRYMGTYLGRVGRIVLDAGYRYNPAHHEYLHYLVFADEYSDECPGRIDSGAYSRNYAKIIPDASYDSDQAARNKHKDAIPWYHHIDPSTPIISSDGTLGTPTEGFDNKLGIFPYVGCNHNGIYYGWKPTKEMSIMQDGFDAEITPYIPLVREALRARGIPEKSDKTIKTEDRTWKTERDGLSRSEYNIRSMEDQLIDMTPRYVPPAN